MAPKERTAIAPATDDVRLMFTRYGYVRGVVTVMLGRLSVGDFDTTMPCCVTSVKDQTWPHAAWGPLGHRPASHSSVGSDLITSALTMSKSAYKGDNRMHRRPSKTACWYAAHIPKWYTTDGIPWWYTKHRT